jgi:hypothetical protein
MEISAAFEAVRAHDGPVEIRSDSTYVVNCFRDRWWEGWLARGWRNAARQPVANRDLWEPFVELVRSRTGVRFSWVKGHSGDRWNDLVDRLAVEALQRQQERTGDQPPDQVGPPDTRPLASVAVEASDPVGGHGLVVLGHRPDGLGEGSQVEATRQRLAAWIERRNREVDDLVVVTGLRQGAEQLAAEAATLAGVPYVAVLPFPDPDRDWPEDARARFATLLGGARSEVLLQASVPASAQAAAGALARRDAWLAHHGREAVLVWDGIEPRLGKLYRSLVDALGDEVLVLDPAHGRTERRGRR